MSASHSRSAPRPGPHLPDAGPWGVFDAHASAAPRLTAESWKSGISGNWNTAADWSAGTVPNSTTDATIAVAGSYTVSIAAAAAAHSLTLNDAAAKVNDTAAFTVATTIALTAGTFTLGIGGIIDGGTVAESGGTFIAAGGTLNNATFQGTLNLTGTIADSAYLYLTGGLNAASGAAVINVTGNDAYLDLYDTQTLNNATLNIGNNGGIYLDRNASAATFTLGAGFNIATAGKNASIYWDSSNETLINQGTITAGTSGGTLDLYSPGNNVFTNTGSLIASNGGTLLFDVNVSTGGLGHFSTSSGGVLEIDGNETLSNTGTTLTVGSGAQLELAGIVASGTISDTGGGLIAAGGTLSGVTYQGTLNITGSSDGLYVTGGLNATAGAIVINLTGSGGAYLDLYDTQTLNNVTLNIGNEADVYLDRIASSATFTLGAGFDMVTAGGQANIVFDSSSETLINNGTIFAGTSGSALVFSNYSHNVVTNTGSLIATGGGTIDLSSTGISNITNGMLTGGYYEADAKSVLDILYSAAVVTDASTIVLSGAGSVFELYNPTRGTYVAIDTTLGTIAIGGTLELLAGRGLTASNAFTDSGLLQLGGATFGETSLTIGAGGRISGFGTVTPAIANGGTIEAKGGVLLVSGAGPGPARCRSTGGRRSSCAAAAPARKPRSSRAKAR